MLTLASLKAVRQKRLLQPAQLMALTGLTRIRLSHLENHTREISEPWFSEACTLARVLNVPGIRDLMLSGKLKASDHLTAFEIGSPMTTDYDIWRSGMAMNLSTACRIAVMFGLDDPYDLIDIPTSKLNQIWATLEAGERSSAPGSCPWCLSIMVGDAAHLPTCLPHNLLAWRDRRVAPNVSFSPAPKYAGGPHGVGAIAFGLKRIRLSHGYSQKQMGALFGVNSDYYSKLERGTQKLVVTRAECLANKLGIDVNSVYHA